MRRKRIEHPTAESESGRGEYIGFITTPIADNQLERAKTILKRHAVRLEKIPTPDNWWTLFLPDGSTKLKQKMDRNATLYTIRLPDGYQFRYRAPVFNHDKSYDTFPQITVLDEPEEVRPSAMSLHVSMINKKHQTIPDHIVLDSTRIVHWFYHELNMPYDEVVLKVENWRALQLDQIRTLRRIKHRLSTLKSLVAKGYIQPDKSLQTWLEPYPKLP